MSKIIKIIDERETQKQKQKQKKTHKKNRTRGTAAITKGWEINDFVERLSFFFNLEWALSVISNKRELYESKDVAVKCRCLKIWDLLSFLICSQS